MFDKVLNASVENAIKSSYFAEHLKKIGAKFYFSISLYYVRFL